MQGCVWYISKYVTPPYASRVGTRGFMLLREFVRSGHSAALITSDSNHLATPPSFSGSHYFETVDGVAVIWLKAIKYGSARSFARILSWFHFEWRLLRLPKTCLPKPDVIIVSSLSLLTVLTGLWLRRRHKCRLVFEVRDIWPLVLIDIGRVHPWHPLVLILGWVERLGYRKADLVVGTMPNLAEHVATVLEAEREVVCIPQGIDPDLLKSPLPLPDRYASDFIPEGKFIICHAGSIGADNALETLIACARAMEGRQDIHFLIVGEGYLKAQLQKQTAGWTNITFAPGVSKGAVQSVLERADVLYFAAHKSRIQQYGQSLNKVIDYMLAGKPIVASYSGYPSMIDEAGCGVFVPVEDVDALRAEFEALARLSPAERRTMGERGRAWLLENRRFETLAEDYLRHLGFAPPMRNTASPDADHASGQ